MEDDAAFEKTCSDDFVCLLQALFSCVSVWNGCKPMQIRNPMIPAQQSGIQVLAFQSQSHGDNSHFQHMDHPWSQKHLIMKPFIVFSRTRLKITTAPAITKDQG